MQGSLKLFTHRRTELDWNDIPWSGVGKGAIDHPSWRMWLHSLKWVDQLVAGSLRSGPEGGSSFRELAVKVAQSWIAWDQSQGAKTLPAWDGHASGLRLTTLVGLAELVDEPWIRNAVRAHTIHCLSDDFFDGHWNHGVVQSIGGLAGALLLNLPEEIKRARSRLMDSFSVMIDSEGAVNEQATGYGRYVARLLETVVSLFDQNGFQEHIQLQKSLAKLRQFIYHSIEPSGDYVQLGDSYPNDESSGEGKPRSWFDSADDAEFPPAARVKVYREGYVFGRSGWGESRPFSDESFYSVRFGRGRVIHGHNDHMSVTWYDHGRNLIIDSGHSGYAPGVVRDHLRSPSAHNVLEIVGHRHDWSVATSLTSHQQREHSSFYEFEDSAYGVKRTRTMLAVDKGPLIFVDRAGQNGRQYHFRQLWHIAPEFELAESSQDMVRFSSARGDLELVLIRFHVTRENLHGHSGMSYWRGNLEPVQGIVARREGEALPAPCVGFDVKGEQVFLLTAAVAVPAGEDLGWSLRSDTDTTCVLRIHVGQDSFSIDVNRMTGMLSLRSRPGFPADLQRKWDKP
ncbi:hypothetical protein E2F48_00940 [Arthrobacter crusticola]|uniref:Heparinase II/III-like C-terminal domain-containing protein n=1 Tax=Arthrobacter crusticola TaxID=2547960 RepID=A0A4R5U2B6_9MICC|nr:heparinase II/III family protein [Arthrobacter crusticola]TDK27732.1 hypothetical protein E2F48_00940 [Arthrobacter crusticola]